MHKEADNLKQDAGSVASDLFARIRAGQVGKEVRTFHNVGDAYWISREASSPPVALERRER